RSARLANVGDHERRGNQLLLPSRRLVRCAVSFEPDQEIRAMRPDLRMSERDVPLLAFAQCHGERALPARPKLDVQPTPEQPLPDLGRRHRQPLDVARAHRGDRLARLNERAVPRYEPNRTDARFQRGISLPENTSVPLPDLEIRVFHVEHAPVDEPAALARPTFHQAVDARVDHVDAEDSSDVRDRDASLAVDAVLEPPRIDLRADSLDPLAAAMVDDDREARSTVLN